MPLRERIFAKFYQIASGTLRLGPNDCEDFASGVANAHAGLHVVRELCTAANGLQSATLHAMFGRWFSLLPEYDIPRRILEAKPGAIAAFPEIDRPMALLCHSRVFEVCMSERKLAESQALQVAKHVTAAVSGFFALEQACMFPEEHTQRRLCSVLRAALGQPLAQAQAAAKVYLSTNDT